MHGCSSVERDNLYPFPASDLFGQLVTHQVNVCAYANAIPLMAFTKLMDCSKRRIDAGAFYHGDFDLERLKRMGINSLHQNSSVRTPVLIAPAPMSMRKDGQVSGIDHGEHGLSKADRKRRRQIKKREAAARSYARKREKRIADLRDEAPSVE